MSTLWGQLVQLEVQYYILTHWIIDGSVAKVNTHFSRDPKESCDEIITLQYTLLLELQGGRQGERERERESGVHVVHACMFILIPYKRHLFLYEHYIPYSRKIWRGIEFGGLVVYVTIAKLKSANILVIVILGSTAKFNSRQYFRLYSMCIVQLHRELHVHKEDCSP